MKESDFYFVPQKIWRECLADAHEAVVRCGLEEYIRENNVRSYMYDTPVEKKEAFKKMASLADKRVGHSGSSFGMTMRMVEDIIKRGFGVWKIEYIVSKRPDMTRAAVVIQRAAREALANPDYELCRKRLTREFNHFSF